MKKIIAAILSVLLIVTMLSGCSGNGGNNGSGKLNIVTTIFPIYDWVTQVLGNKADGAELTMLLDNGVDLHSYQPTADDIVKISSCDLFIYVGGESDKWVDDVMKNKTNDDMVVINLMQTLGDSIKEEEVVEGMQGEDEDGEEEEGPEYDEHIWLSLKNSQLLVEAISEGICKIDSGNKDTYSANAKKYVESLRDLDSQYQSAVDAASVKTLVFGDRFPFRYMVDDYNLEYYAAFVGCSAESEASFETVTFLANKTDELSLRHICIIEGSDGRIAQTIIQNTKDKNQTVVTFDSMQSTTSKDVSEGLTYLSVMQNNLESLRTALS